MIVAGTGHRPVNLPCKYDENDKWFLDLKKKLLTKMKKEKPERVISGVAIGWDTWIAEVALECGIPVHCYVPFRDQGSNWPYPAQKRYATLLDNAEKVYYIHELYSKQAFIDRDKCMINDCTDVWSLWNPEIESGGTYITVQYALKQNRPIYNFWTGSKLVIKTKPKPKDVKNNEFKF